MEAVVFVVQVDRMAGCSSLRSDADPMGVRGLGWGVSLQRA